jgi:hypothetical protein
MLPVTPCFSVVRRSYNNTVVYHVVSSVTAVSESDILKKVTFPNYNAFGKYSDTITFSTFYYVTDLF